MKKSEIKQLLIGIFVFTLICIGTSCSAQSNNEKNNIKDIISYIKLDIILENNVKPTSDYKLYIGIPNKDIYNVYNIKSKESIILHTDNVYIFDITYKGYNTFHFEVITNNMNSSRIIDTKIMLLKGNKDKNNGKLIFNPELGKFIVYD